MTELTFVKMQASGNDFILIKNFDGRIKDGSGLARALCRRRISVGADGLILIEPPKDPKNAFSWRFFNSDGSEAEMCGNGGRCAARFAVEEGLSGSRLSFETRAGVIRAEVFGTRVKVQLTPPKDLRLGLKLSVEGALLEVHFVNTGVPHAVLFFEDVSKVDVPKLGRAVRFHEAFAPAGTNVNFVKVVSGNEVELRTYERGVEDETLSCGTGAAASAFVSTALGLTKPPVKVLTRSGEVLTVHIPSKDVLFLEGETRKVFRGLLYPEALGG